MLHISLLNRRGVINHANILFRSKSFKKSLLLELLKTLQQNFTNFSKLGWMKILNAEIKNPGDEYMQHNAKHQNIILPNTALYIRQLSAKALRMFTLV
jgi:hypothetical protein